MADDAVLFVSSNPVPEIWPWEAAEAGARVIATGRSDFPNQVNNSLGFPGIFRGTLDVRARTITDEMCIAAARELALVAEEKGLDEEHIVPTMEEIDVFARGCRGRHEGDRAGHRPRPQDPERALRQRHRPHSTGSRANAALDAGWIHPAASSVIRDSPDGASLGLSPADDMDGRVFRGGREAAPRVEIGRAHV